LFISHKKRRFSFPEQPIFRLFFVYFAQKQAPKARKQTPFEAILYSLLYHFFIILSIQKLIYLRIILILFMFFIDFNFFSW